MGIIEDAYNVAMGLRKPLMRLCADVITADPVNNVLYSSIAADAQIQLEGRAMLIGRYASLLHPNAERHLQRNGIPFSDMAVDGVLQSGGLNLRIWLQRSDLERITPLDISRACHGVPGIRVMERFERFRDLPTGIPYLGRVVGMSTPVTAKIVYDEGRDQRDDPTFEAIPPNVAHLYGAEPFPPHYLEAMHIIGSGGAPTRDISPDALALLQALSGMEISI